MQCVSRVCRLKFVQIWFDITFGFWEKICTAKSERNRSVNIITCKKYVKNPFRITLLTLNFNVNLFKSSKMLLAREGKKVVDPKSTRQKLNKLILLYQATRFNTYLQQ